MAKPPAIRVIPVSPTCGKVYCRECEHFLGLQHADGDSPVVEDCPGGQKNCASQETLNEFQDAITRQIQEEQANRILFDTLLAEDPFADGDEL